ncbi:MAG: radical SAM protein [Alphaproteobacteria bacterium]|nr:radical SAM protein [Alphaproteobacteria bacterium]
METDTAKKFVVSGLDSFSKEELDNFWAERRKGNVNLLVLGLTTKNVCNLRCLYCFGTDKKSEEAKTQMTLDEYRRVVDEAVELGVKSIVYCSNGEPLMDDNLLPILSHVHRRGLSNVILTNGTLMGNDRLARLVHNMNAADLTKAVYDNNASLIMSLDSLEESTYDEIVNVKGSYAFAQRALANIEKTGFTKTTEENGVVKTRLLLSMLATKTTFHEIPVVRDFAHKFGSQFVVKLPSMLGRANDNKHLMFANNETTRWIREDYLRRMSDKKETVSADDVGKCGVWHYGMVVGSDGTIRQCFSVGDIGIGNIKDTSLRNLAEIRQEKYLERLFNNGCLTKDMDYKDPFRPEDRKRETTASAFRI